MSSIDCIEIGTPSHQINLRGGSTHRLTGGVIFFVELDIMHPMYRHPDNLRGLDYDIGLMRVQADSPIQGYNVAIIPISPICTADPICCQACAPTMLAVSGWGRLANGSSSPTLNQLHQPIHDHADCNRIWGRIGPNFFCKSVFDGRYLGSLEFFYFLN